MEQQQPTAAATESTTNVPVSTEEWTDDEAWEQAGQQGSDDTEAVIDATQSSSSSNAASAQGSSDDADDEATETFEMEAPSEPSEAEKKAQHDYEKRYKDLEREFHRRNEETKQLREEFQQLRLERLEMQQQLEKLRQQPTGTGKGAEAKEARQPSPLDEDWFDPDTQQTLSDFEELTKAYKKLIAHEVAKATQGLSPDSEKLSQLEAVAQQYKANQYRLQHAAYMRETVGADFMEIDVDPDFDAYVRSSPMRLHAMTKSLDPRDHAAVMQDFLNTPAGREKFRSNAAATPTTSAKATDPGKVRRQAAQGLLKNSSPRQNERRLEDMSDDELWDAISA